MNPTKKHVRHRQRMAHLILLSMALGLALLLSACQPTAHCAAYAKAQPAKAAQHIATAQLQHMDGGSAIGG